MQTQILIFGWLFAATLFALTVVYLDNMKNRKKSARVFGIAVCAAMILPAVLFFYKF